MCSSNLAAISKISDNSAVNALADGAEISFSIVRPAERNQIPKNYFCSWSILINPEEEYQLSIKRDFYPINEQLELNIIGDNKK